MLDRIRVPIRRWPLASVAVAVVLATIVAAAIGAAGPQDHVRRLQHENGALSTQLSRTAEEADQANAELLRVQDRLDEATKKLSLAGYKQRKRDLARQVADLSAQISDEEAKLHTVKQEVAKSSFGDGTWQANVDFIPGTYESPGGDECYWAKLSSPSGEGVDNIIDNGGFNNRPVVSVDSPYFETSNCGTWHRVG